MTCVSALLENLINYNKITARTLRFNKTIALGLEVQVGYQALRRAVVTVEDYILVALKSSWLTGWSPGRQ